ncbi:MAG: hypothetical protein H0T18_02930 [Chloroflexia bacterium]|nr:hypothetical protein [Chloroflexia bacterium]
MNKPHGSDLLRQFANVFAAIFQVCASYVVGSSVGTIAQQFHSLIIPATYAFAIWGPIFILCAVYAVYQALPAQRENAVFRAIGWWTAGAFLANGAWSYAYTNQQFIIAQLIIFAGFVFAGGAYLQFVRNAPAANPTAIDQSIVGPALGLLFGWITAANVVGLASTLIALGFAAQGQGAALGGVALLLLGEAIAFMVIVTSRNGPSSAWIAFAAAVLWALVAVVIEQRSASLLTSATAVACALLIIVAIFGPWRTPTRSFGRPAAAG